MLGSTGHGRYATLSGGKQLIIVLPYLSLYCYMLLSAPTENYLQPKMARISVVTIMMHLVHRHECNMWNL
jgi:hypothetical protein